jgi:hypothetical protein
VAVALLGNWVAAGARLDGGIGDIRVEPARVDGRTLEVRRAVGDVAVDLRRTLSSEPIVLRTSVGKGTLRVALPGRARVRVDARVGQGELSSIPLTGNGVSDRGFDLHATDRWRPRYTGPARAPEIRVIADVGIGNLQVSRARDFLAGALEP